MGALRKYFDFPVSLGYAGSAGFFISEHFEIYGGMVLTAITIATSIIMQWQKISSIRNDERRKEERHRMEMKFYNGKNNSNG